MDFGITTELCAEKVSGAVDALESPAEHDLRHSAAVEGRGVDEVHSEIERGVDGAEGFIEIDGSEFGTKRGGSKGKAGEFEAALAERTSFHSDEILIEDKGLGEICLTDFEWEGKFGKMRVNRAKMFNVGKERIFSIF